jgi:GNAT superfamily N-acetyltransferase
MSEGAKEAALEVVRGNIGSTEAQALITELNAELSARYPEPGATHFLLHPEQVASGRGTFLVAKMDGEPVGCGALRRIEEQAGEIKRMYVRPVARGNGVGRSILAALEDEARRLGMTRLVLETGVRQLEAIALYESMGFTRIEPYGEYLGSRTSVCMAKDL